MEATVLQLKNMKMKCGVILTYFDIWELFCMLHLPQVYILHLQKPCLHSTSTKSMSTFYIYKRCIYILHLQKPYLHYTSTKAVSTFYIYKSRVYILHLQKPYLHSTSTKFVSTFYNSYFPSKKAVNTFSHGIRLTLAG
jgi:hypothetical protein